MNCTDAQFALRKWRRLLVRPTFIAIVIAAAAISTVNEVSLNASLFESIQVLLGNLALALISAAVASFGILLVNGVIGERISTIPRFGLAGLVSSPFVFASVIGVNALFDLALPDSHKMMEAFVSVIVTVTAIALIIGVFEEQRGIETNAGLQKQSETGAMPDGNGNPVNEDGLSGFMRRLPPELGSGLIRLSASDHYVEAYTRHGHAMILLRFSDALGELDGADGLQIHRSHWVARSAIRRLVTKNRRLMVELEDGTCLPVSRSRLGAIRAEGFPEA